MKSKKKETMYCEFCNKPMFKNKKCYTCLPLTNQQKYFGIGILIFSIIVAIVLIENIK